MDKDILELLGSETAHVARLQEIVRKSIEGEQLIINNLLHPPDETLTYGQKISDRVARFGGSWTFIVWFFSLLFLWIIYNSVVASNTAWDPYPFILMNLILSCIAAIQAPIIMMSQNRVEEKDRKRSENDYMINLKSELELRALHEKIDVLLEEQIKILFQSQAKQLELLKTIEKKLSEMKSHGG
ncbi:MAG: DUF1003 domain-containing protein [Flavobacterium sp.]|nr:MAG: DUF1003 domain-containing protein [Flavobacterium sp.]